MSRKTKRNANGFIALIITILIIIGITAEPPTNIGAWILLIGTPILIILLKIIKRQSETKQDNNTTTYSQTYTNQYQNDNYDYNEYKNVVSYQQKSLMSPIEKQIFHKIQNAINTNNFYSVQPQINLASVINKFHMGKYQNELFRNIDFGIFDNDYNIKILIELNDRTHATQERHTRDLKVREILQQARIPLVTLYTSYENTEEYIKKRLKEYIEI